MSARRLRNQPVDAAIRFGRRIHTRKAVIYVIGRKEVEKWNFRGIDLSGFEGIHAVCSADGRILTVYRNRSLRGLRPHRRGRRVHYAVKFR